MERGAINVVGVCEAKVQLFRSNALALLCGYRT